MLRTGTAIRCRRVYPASKTGSTLQNNIYEVSLLLSAVGWLILQPADSARQNLHLLFCSFYLQHKMGGHLMQGAPPARSSWKETQVMIRFFPLLLSFTSVPSLHNKNRLSSLVIAFLLLTPKLSHNFDSINELHLKLCACGAHRLDNKCLIICHFSARNNNAGIRSPAHEPQSRA